MLNLCKYIGNYFSIKSFHYIFALQKIEIERQNHQKSNRNVFETGFQECNYG
jgi:hypothetical protein